jgi:hypothetical protein
MGTFRTVATVVAMALVISLPAMTVETPPAAKQVQAVDDLDPGATVETCRQVLVDDHFPDVIVYNVLVDRGVSKSDIKLINQKLDSDSKDLREDFVQVVVEEEEPVATNDPLSDVYNYDALKDARLVVFREVMKDYVDDAGMVIQMYNKIESERDKQLKACGKIADET